MSNRCEFLLAGPHDHALTHFAAAGLAEILFDAGVRDVAWGWADGRVPVARVLSRVSPADLAMTVHEHAARHCTKESWVQAEFANPRSKSSSRGVLSPRLAIPGTTDAWCDLELDRRRALDRVDPGSALDQRFIAALGRPAYWRDEGSQRNPDAGASRWEMKARNRGQQFVGDRLAPLAEVVAARSPELIRAGLEGASRRDELGKDNPESRTATGLAVPGPVDSAIAWCALWGIAATGTWWNPGGIATTSCVFPARATHPRWAVLPIATRPISPARYRSIHRSADWNLIGEGLGREVPEGGLTVAGAMSALAERGVAAALVCRIRKAGSQSAPERYLLPGRVIPIVEGPP